MYDHDIRREEKKKSDDYKQLVTFKKKTYENLLGIERFIEDRLPTVFMH